MKWRHIRKTEIALACFRHVVVRRRGLINGISRIHNCHVLKTLSGYRCSITIAFMV